MYRIQKKQTLVKKLPPKFNNNPPAISLSDNETMRIAKFIASCGICSRRDAEKLISEGKVKINNQVIETPAIQVGSQDIVKVNDEVITLTSSQIYLYYKPQGLITTHKDEKGRTTVFESLPSHLPRVISVGRLDVNSEGLLILTTDSNIAHYLESPQNELERTYKVRVFGRLDLVKLEEISKKGLRCDGIRYKPFEYEIINQTPNNTWLEITIHEGKNREVRNIMEYLEVRISRLIRIKYAMFSLGNLLPGKIIKVADIATQNLLKIIKDENNHRNTQG
ncbi:pseudouridine synthase [Rickettsiales endosymbiont of Stachyamoeba lipophora]|uniref:pseudouridine synthase n=1 Tax=Rickettsiales endosymbiont of Stachyamoeba lipophora TaxID=2486578 RepID=UPI000F646B82|nr:pseudouridine synthase [Rickettsiales endosymbiont of Stachyamoeba lipophora]AZL16279.1 rRNA pseudouridine synthase [Rickettsiales endosymbiont of Stachyamoeba lipophora]